MIQGSPSPIKKQASILSFGRFSFHSCLYRTAESSLVACAGVMMTRFSGILRGIFLPNSNYFPFPGGSCLPCKYLLFFHCNRTPLPPRSSTGASFFRNRSIGRTAVAATFHGPCRGGHLRGKRRAWLSFLLTEREESCSSPLGVQPPSILRCRGMRRREGFPEEPPFKDPSSPPTRLLYAEPSFLGGGGNSLSSGLALVHLQFRLVLFLPSSYLIRVVLFRSRAGFFLSTWRWDSAVFDGADFSGFSTSLRGSGPFALLGAKTSFPAIAGDHRLLYRGPLVLPPSPTRLFPSFPTSFTSETCLLFAPRTDSLFLNMRYFRLSVHPRPTTVSSFPLSGFVQMFRDLFSLFLRIEKWSSTGRTGQLSSSPCPLSSPPPPLGSLKLRVSIEDQKKHPPIR